MKTASIKLEQARLFNFKSFKFSFIFILVLLVNIKTFAQQPAKIIFMRATGIPGAVYNYKGFVDGKLTTILGNNRYSEHDIAPGKRIISTQFWGKKSKAKASKINIDVEPGKTYYVQMILQMGLLTNNILCQEVTENSAKAVWDELERDN